MKYESILLSEKRKLNIPIKKPFPHQYNAFEKMNEIFNNSSLKTSSGLVVIPTGGGKTFTAVQWICNNILAKNIKVIWLAHTYHLLDQARATFNEMSPNISQPKEILNIRVISGHQSHCKPSEIKLSDDLIIMTTQTAISNFETNDLDQNGKVMKTSFLKFIEDNKKNRIFIVLDEAHHAPASGCRNFLLSLKKKLPKYQLLGLTATPTYTDKRRRGWLKHIFENGIIYQAKEANLKMQKILANPKFIEVNTETEVSLDDKQYDSLVRQHKDVPEDIIEHLANNKKRNDCIIKHYLDNKKKYGKTIIFTDRWYQCEYIKEKLNTKKVKVDAIYARQDAQLSTPEERNRQDSDSNKKAIENFKNNKIDVLINIKMLTEGTDVPNVQTVFITRHTTSKILFTQMVGRALRGPKAGGGDKKENANIVIFSDNWKHLIHWASHNLSGGLDNTPIISGPSPMEYISISLIQKLVKQMEPDTSMSYQPYSAIIPLGWYDIEYTITNDNDESNESKTLKKHVIIYNKNADGFKKITQKTKLNKEEKKEWEKENLSIDWLQNKAVKYINMYFDLNEDNFGNSLEDDITHIMRHIAQNGTSPQFISFSEKDEYDLDKICEELYKEGMSRSKEDERFRVLYEREGNLFKVWYKNYNNFKNAVNHSMEIIIDRDNGRLPQGVLIKQNTLTQEKKEDYNQKELTSIEKKQVKKRDNNECLCCGYNKDGRKLEIDHIKPVKYGGNTKIESSQTLCKYCNKEKGTNYINFRNNKSTLTEPKIDIKAIKPWEHDREFEGKPIEDRKSALKYAVQRMVNLFYHCHAVYSIELNLRKNGQFYKKWEIILYPENDIKWLKKHKKKLLAYTRTELKQKQVKKIEIVSLENRAKSISN